MVVDEKTEVYMESLFNDVPLYVYESILFIFCVSVILLLIYRGKESAKGIFRLLFIEYLFLIFCSTVLFRETKDVRKYEFIPFWSYERADLFPEIVMNVVVFVPVGLLFGVAFKKMKWLSVLLSGICISVSIEILQLLSKRGFAEVDDVIHNTSGCAIGFGVYSLIKYGYEKVSKRSMASN